MGWPTNPQTSKPTKPLVVDQNALRRTFERAFGRDPEIVAEAPGRVNLIGEHTDYNQGFVLPVAINRRVTIAAAPAEGKRVRVYSADFDARDEWQVDAPRRTGRREWRDYVRGVAWVLLDAGHELRGADLAIAGDVPQGAGLSSSAALEVAVAGALCAVSGQEVEPQQLAVLCQKAENQFVGVQCGIMDQLAAACAWAEHALLIDCRSLQVERVPLPDDVAIVVVDSKVQRALRDTAYNERRGECAAAARALGVASLRDAAVGDVDRLPQPLNRRARHVITENRRVLEAVAALRSDNLNRFGELIYESHASLRDDFEVSTPELDLLVELALRTEGVIGARLTGAGFGGCTVNLVEREAVGRFEAGIIEPYRAKTGLSAKTIVCRAIDGLRVSRHR
jgi:galactokinase